MVDNVTSLDGKTSDNQLVIEYIGTIARIAKIRLCTDGLAI